MLFSSLECQIKPVGLNGRPVLENGIPAFLFHSVAEFFAWRWVAHRTPEIRLIIETLNISVFRETDHVILVYRIGFLTH